MLVQSLRLAIESLQSLIDITKIDIEDIKIAAHDKLFSRVRTKDELIKQFESYKRMIDTQISTMAKNSPDIDLVELLSTEERELLGKMRDKLNELKDANKHYAKIVVAVSSFYNSMLENFVPKNMQEHGGSYAVNGIKPASFVEVKA
jgi:uncharacterized protein YcbK (DUF882 family)